MGAGTSMTRKALVGGMCALAIATLAFGAQDKTDYTGFWKSNCEDPMGLLIKPLRNGLYFTFISPLNRCSVPPSLC